MMRREGRGGKDFDLVRKKKSWRLKGEVIEERGECRTVELPTISCCCFFVLLLNIADEQQS